MKEKLTRNIGLKILSVILAAILWLVITNVDDPIKTKNFYNVPVEILNEDAIASLNQVYDIKEGETIDFTVAARRSIIENLAVSDFSVTADFSKLSDVNAVTIDISCLRYRDEVTVSDGLYQVMKVSLEEQAEKHFRVDVVQKGEPSEGYYVAEKTASTIVQVSGPKSKIESITQIKVDVDVTDVAGSFRTTEQPKAIDAEGNEIDSSNLNFSEKSISVNILMYKTKTIDLLVTTSGKPRDGYVLTSVEYEPKTIEIAGEDVALSEIQRLEVTEDIDGIYKNVEKEINLQEALGKELILIENSQTAVVNLKVERAKTKDIVVQLNDIDVRNIPKNLEVTILNTTPILIRMMGPEKDINNITVNNLKPFIDLTDYADGTYDVKIQAGTSLYSIIQNNPSVRVQLS
jgi:YbbR domain-containing protein